jgi:hypothetical protein
LQRREKETPRGNVGEMRGRLQHLQQLILRLKRKKKRDGGEKTLVEAAWVADTQLQLSQLSYLDADRDQQE